MITLTSVAAQNGFGKLLDTVQREVVTVTRHGRPVAFIVSPEDMDELLDARRKRSRAVASLEQWRVQANQQMSEKQKAASAKLTDEDVTRMVREAR
jgi:prevent-host-death family protein